MNDDGTPDNFSKPVAYDQYGRPLYAHPPQESAQSPQPQQQPQPQQPDQQNSADNNRPQVVYLSRAIDPHQQEISPEIQRKHEESKRKYPGLNLSEGEYVISALKRHPIGLISVWLLLGVVILAVLALQGLLMAAITLPVQFSSNVMVILGFGMLLLIMVMILSGLIYTVVYQANRFYLTNESVTQHIQSSLFSKKDQTISLGNIEDASYRKHGILQTVLNYGSIRLSKEGEETTYRFNFVANPEYQVRLLNDAVEAFKNFRPVTGPDQED